MHDHEIYDNTPSSYLDDIADIGEKHIRLSYPNFILLLARLDTDYNYAQYLVRTPNIWRMSCGTPTFPAT